MDAEAEIWPLPTSPEGSGGTGGGSSARGLPFRLVVDPGEDALPDGQGTCSVDGRTIGEPLKLAAPGDAAVTDWRLREVKLLLDFLRTGTWWKVASESSPSPSAP